MKQAQESLESGGLSFETSAEYSQALPNLPEHFGLVWK